MSVLSELKVKLLHPQARVPTRADTGAAGYDLYSVGYRELMEGSQLIVNTGVAITIPDGMVGLICPRSGLAAKECTTVFKGPGVLDSSYTGEVKVLLRREREDWNLISLPQEPLIIKPGDRIAQLVVVPCFMGDVRIVEELEETDRGSGGFGSTGK